jgi:hypothetical protein
MSSSACSRTLSSLFAAVALVACGGGGDAAVPPPVQAPLPPPVQAPLPPPVQAPAPPAAPALPAAPFSLTATQSFTVLGWVAAAGSSAWSEIDTDTATFGWSSTLGTYELAVKDVGSGRLAFAFADNNPVAFTLRREDGSTLPLWVTVTPQIASAGRLWWSPSSGDDLSTGIAAFGVAAAASDIPGSGARNFFGEDLPEYAPTIDFDFDAGRLTGKVRVAWEDAWGPYPPTTYDLTPASFDRSANMFAATFSVPGAPALGSIRGMFMGPGAREVAIAWQSPIVDPYETRWVTARGVWLGRCTNCGR